ncbi:MAG: hypothetical protein AAB729_01475, partial [Patescibacteria group bacterium]
KIAMDKSLWICYNRYRKVSSSFEETKINNNSTKYQPRLPGVLIALIFRAIGYKVILVAKTSSSFS